jgi:hypothetical protein
LTSVRKRSLPVDMAQRCGVREAQWNAVSRQSAPMRQSRVRCTRRRQHALALRRRAVVTQARPRQSYGLSSPRQAVGPTSAPNRAHERDGGSRGGFDLQTDQVRSKMHELRQPSLTSFVMT